MASGKLEVLLVGAQDLKDRRLLGKMNPYVLVQYGDQEQRSDIAKAQGKNPVWNNKFSFGIKCRAGQDQLKKKLILTILDRNVNNFSCGAVAEDLVGQTTIYVKDVVQVGIEKGKAKLERTMFRVVLPNKTYAGQISVFVKFTSSNV